MNFDLRSRTALRIAQTTAAGLGILALGACGNITAPVHVQTHPAKNAAHGFTPAPGKHGKHGKAGNHNRQGGNPGRAGNPVNPGNPVHAGHGPAVRMCAHEDLGVRVTPDGGAAGHAISRIDFINVSGSPCYLKGFAGVAYLDGGNEVGRGPSRAPGSAMHRVRLAPNGHAYSFLDQPNYQNYPASECDPAKVTSIRVWVPLSDESRIVPFSSTVCGNGSTGTSTITAVSANPNAH